MGKRTLAGSLVFLAILCATVPSRIYAQEDRDYLRTGTAYFRNGEYEEALEDLKKARLQDPGSAVAAYYLGLTYKKMVDFPSAAENLKDAVTLQPPVKEAFVELADAYYAIGRNDEALHAVEVAEREGVEPAQTAFMKGLILSKKRSFTDALASFQLAKSLDPKLSATADFQTAVVLQRQGKNEEALNLYLAVAAAEPDSDVGQMARQQADAMISRPEKKTFHAAADVQYQYDDNVVLKPDAVVTNISGESDASTLVTARVEYAPELSPRSSLKLQYAFSMNSYQTLTTYNVQSHTAGLAPAFRIGEDTAQLQLSWNSTLVDKTGYLRSLAASPVYSIATGEAQYAEASLRYQKNDYLTDPPSPDEDRTGNDAGAGISWTALVAEQKGYFNLKYEFNQEKTKGVNWSYQGNKLVAGALYPFSDDVQAMLSLEGRVQDFDNINTTYLLTRKDTSYTAVLQGLLAVVPHVDLHLQYLYSKSDSTIPVYSYTKNVFGIGLYAKY